MLRSPINAFGASTSDTITLLSGQTVPLIYVKFIPSTYQFIYQPPGGNATDVTYKMTATQKQLFPGFDQTEWNYRLYNINHGQGNTPAKLETSVSKLFMQNVAEDLAKKTDLGVSSFSRTLGFVIGGLVVYLVVTNLPKKKKK